MKCLICGKDLTEPALVFGLCGHEIESIHAHAHLTEIASIFARFIETQTDLNPEVKKAKQEYDFLSTGNILER